MEWRQPLPLLTRPRLSGRLSVLWLSPRRNIGCARIARHTSRQPDFPLPADSSGSPDRNPGHQLRTPTRYCPVSGRPYDVAYSERIDGKGFMAGDQQLTCSDCGQEFTFSSEDQEFFRERGYSAPKRCKPCRQAKKNEQTGGGGYQRNESQGTTVTCSGCGKQTTVPFEPRGDRPVYCQDCYNARKRSDSGRGFRRGGR